jgi:hypothetical protein
MHKVVIMMHIILLNVERMNEKYTVKLREVESTPQYRTKFSCENKSSDSWFPSYCLLTIKENVHEFPCRHGRRETSESLLCSTASDWGLLL